MDFWRTLEVLAKRKWIILISGLLTLALVYLATKDSKSTWSAKVTLMAPPPAVNPSALGKIGEAAISDPEEPEGRAEMYESLLKSERVLAPALKLTGGVPDIEEFLKDISIEGIGSGLYALEVRGEERVGVEKMANALGDNLQEAGSALYTSRLEEAVRILRKELRTADREIAALNARHEAARHQYGIVEKLSDHLTPALSRLNVARFAVEESRTQVGELRVRLRARTEALNSVPAVIPAPAAEQSALEKKLQDELADAERRLTVLQARYTDEVGEVKVARSIRDAIRLRLEKESGQTPSGEPIPNPARKTLQDAVTNLREELAAAEALLGQQVSTLSSARKEVTGFSGADAPLAELATELARRSENRAGLEARLRTAEISLDAASRQNPLLVLQRVNEFNPPVNLTAGKKLRLILMAVMAAMVLVAGGAIALDALDRRLRTLPQAELLLPTPLLTAVPQAVGAVRVAQLGDVVRSSPLSPHAEAYHFVSSSLGSHCPQGATLLVTSPRAGVGSARTAANVALSLAQSGKRVVLADFNLRRPMLHEMFGAENGAGVAELLGHPGLEDLELLLQEGPVEGLSLLTAGSPTSSPWELLHSRTLPELLRSLRRKADFVIVDTPCAVAFSDVLELAPHVDGAVLCIRAQEQPTGSEERVARSLEALGARFYGTVLYDVPVAALEGYQSHLYCLETATRRKALRSR